MSLGSEIAAGRAYVELLLKDDSFKAKLKKNSEWFKGWGESLKKFGTSLRGYGDWLLSPFKSALPIFVQSGAKLNDLAQRIGAPIDDLQRLGYAGEQSGISLEEMMPSLIYFEKYLAKSGKSGKDLASTLLDVADELKTIDDPAKRIEFMAERFGKAGAALIPLLQGGSGELNGLFNRADSLGIVMRPEDIEAAAKMDDTYAELNATMRAFGNTLAASVIPYLQPMLELAVKAVAIGTKWIDKNRSLAVGIAATGAALVGLAGIIVALGTIATAVATAIGGFAAALAFVVTPTGILVISIGAVVAAVAALAAGVISLTGQWRNLGNAISGWANEALAGMDAVLHMLMSDQWEAAAGVMALSVLKALQPLLKVGIFGAAGLALGQFDVDGRLKEVKDAVERAKALDKAWMERRQKEKANLPAALGMAAAIAQPAAAVGFMGAGQARAFGIIETKAGLEQRQLRQLELIREAIQRQRPMQFR